MYNAILLFTCISALLTVAAAAKIGNQEKKAEGLRIQLDNLKLQHAQELEKVQKEIFQQALEDISRELHDDFGQRLSLVKLRLSSTLAETPIETRAFQTETKEMTAQLLQDLRNLTRYLHLSSAKHISLPEVIQEELDRILRSGFSSTGFAIVGVPRTLALKTNLFVLRIFQESLNNVIAHAQASHCHVELLYESEYLQLQIRDNGIGFQPPATPESRVKGLGLRNITQRCRLIDGHVSIDSSPSKGTTVSIRIPYLPSTPTT